MADERERPGGADDEPMVDRADTATSGAAPPAKVDGLARSLTARALAAHRRRPYALLWGITTLALVAYVALVAGPWNVGPWVHTLLVIAAAFALTGIMQLRWRAA